MVELFFKEFLDNVVIEGEGELCKKNKEDFIKKFSEFVKLGRDKGIDLPNSFLITPNGKLPALLKSLRSGSEISLVLLVNNRANCSAAFDGYNSANLFLYLISDNPISREIGFLKAYSLASSLIPVAITNRDIGGQLDEAIDFVKSDPIALNNFRVIINEYAEGEIFTPHMKESFGEEVESIKRFAQEKLEMLKSPRKATSDASALAVVGSKLLGGGGK